MADAQDTQAQREGLRPLSLMLQRTLSPECLDLTAEDWAFTSFGMISLGA